MAYTVHALKTGFSDQPFWSLVETFVPAANITVIFQPSNKEQKKAVYDPQYLERCALQLKNLKVV